MLLPGPPDGALITLSRPGGAQNTQYYSTMFVLAGSIFVPIPKGVMLPVFFFAAGGMYPCNRGFTPPKGVMLPVFFLSM